MTDSRHAADIALSRRIAAYLFMLLGYFFYCYNFAVVDYVRPYLVDDYGMTLNETALLYTALSAGAIAGAVAVAWMATHWGKKNTLIFVTVLNGLGTVVNMQFESFGAWFVMRAIIGFSLGGYSVATISMVVSLFPRRYCSRLQAVNASTFSVAIIALGGLGALLGEQSWEALVWTGGVPPLVAAAAMWLVVPDDRRFVAFGEEKALAAGVGAALRKGNWPEMFRGPHLRFTLICLLISGLNFAGYQFFSGFVTTYLKTVRGFEADAMGLLVSAQGFGSFVGGLTWGYLADKTGRRYNAIGFVFTALFICAYFTVPGSVVLLTVLGFGYGFMLACTYSWGVYFTELFPVHLRPMGAALFHGGRIISLLAPSAVALIAESYGLTTGMWLAPLAFVVAAVLWLTLPETLRESPFYRGFEPRQAAAVA